MVISHVHDYFRVLWIQGLFIISILAGWTNGYVTARCMKTAGYADWLGGATFSALAYPIIVLATIIVIDLIEYAEGS